MQEVAEEWEGEREGEWAAVAWAVALVRCPICRQYWVMMVIGMNFLSRQSSSPNFQTAIVVRHPLRTTARLQIVVL
ncbi:hypothetical protein AT959_02250 [Dechloromonas denitrificans]|uniref:Uncharacterized protein n=1 Tax=Dechloromonas denitrificans TaxID=281362 RepID=A0A133XNM2_9RHOO|nr:hypothetical protein AT959_02250 [Dechloromonas denitrificans]